ncbi:hypothetical protein M758_2G189300 [Ceratodon purpureus]|nr:hypothetical protein M758_2G189300 [Ceratodon purpureus]
MATIMLSATPTSLFASRNGVCRPSHASLHLIRIQRISCHVGWSKGRRGWVAAAGGSPSSDEASDVGQVEENAGKRAAPVWKFWQMNAGELKEKVAKLGRAGLLAYGLFNAITYTTMFYVAFLAFEKSTGQNPANNLKACLGGMVTMWTGNNFTRPLRVAGAAALAPFMDKVLKKTQKTFKLKDEATTLLFLVMVLIVLCILAVGLLILSRLGR